MGQTDRPDDRRAAGSRLSSNSESAVKGTTKRRNPESQNARKPRPAPGFLAKSNTCSGQITAVFQSLPNSSRPTIYDMWIGNVGTPASPKIILRVAISARGVGELDVATAGTVAPIKLYLRDNFLDQ